MNKALLHRFAGTLALLLAALLILVLCLLVMPLMEGVDKTPVPGSADWMAALPDETQSLGGGQFALLGDGRRGEHSHAVPGGEGGVGPAEKMGLEKTHGRFRRAGGDVDAE